MKVASISFALFSAFLLAGCQNQAANVAGSREAAERWVAETLPDGYRVAKFSSATLDSDDDGYVTAEVLVTRGDGKYRLIQLQCPTQGVMRLQKGGTAKLHQIPLDGTFEGPVLNQEPTE